MQSLLKLFEGRDTVSRNNSFENKFNRSLILLTLFYTVTLGLMIVVSASFSYSAFSTKLVQRFSHMPTPTAGITIEIRRGPTLEEVREDLVAALIFVNGILLIIAIGLGHGLARLTLHPLKKAYQEQRRFIADASHELRTPLAILHMELESGSVDVASSLEEVKRMTKIVHDLLLLSKLEDNESRITLAPLPLGHAIAKIVERMHGFATTNDVTLRFEKPIQEVSVMANEEALSHALTNLIQNAIIYNKPKGTVDVRLENAEGKATVSVVDTGIGISPEDLEHIFDRFYRSDKSRSRGKGSSGLGLSIAERGIRSLGSTLTVESELGKGTTVKFTL